MAILDVRKSLTFCRQVGARVIGVVENMSGFACPHCGKVTDIFSKGRGEKLCSEMDVPYLGQIPLHADITRCSDEGRSIFNDSVDPCLQETITSVLSKVA